MESAFKSKDKIIFYIKLSSKKGDLLLTVT